MPGTGFIGLGNMGGALARRLARAGPLRVWDRDPRAVAALAGEGAAAAEGPGGVADGADVVLTCLPTSAEVEEVLFAADGVAAAAAPGTLVADMTTGDPFATRRIAARLGERGLGMVDAPVSGGVAGARRGDIAIMVGGPDRLFEQARPVLEAISANVLHAGDAGAGHAMKLINNAVSACARVATFEGLALAVKLGMDPARFAEILSKGTGRGYVADTTLPRFVLQGRRDQGFALALMCKDLALAADLAREAGAPLTAGDRARELFQQALDELGDRADITQVVRIFERAAGVDVCAGTR